MRWIRLITEPLPIPPPPHTQPQSSDAPAHPHHAAPTRPAHEPPLACARTLVLVMSSPLRCRLSFMSSLIFVRSSERSSAASELRWNLSFSVVGGRGIDPPGEWLPEATTVPCTTGPLPATWNTARAVPRPQRPMRMAYGRRGWQPRSQGFGGSGAVRDADREFKRRSAAAKDEASGAPAGWSSAEPSVPGGACQAGRGRGGGGEGGGV